MRPRAFSFHSRSQTRRTRFCCRPTPRHWAVRPEGIRLTPNTQVELLGTALDDSGTRQSLGSGPRGPLRRGIWCDAIRRQQFWSKSEFNLLKRNQTDQSQQSFREEAFGPILSHVGVIPFSTFVVIAIFLNDFFNPFRFLHSRHCINQAIAYSHFEEIPSRRTPPGHIVPMRALPGHSAAWPLTKTLEASSTAPKSRTSFRPLTR